MLPAKGGVFKKGGRKTTNARLCDETHPRFGNVHADGTPVAQACATSATRTQSYRGARRPNRLRGRIGSPSQAINRTASCQPATASSKKMLPSEQSNLFKSSDHGPQARASSSAPERGHPTANVWAAPNLGSAGSAAQIGALGDSAPCPLLLVSLGRPLVSETDRRSQPILRR